jgi:geranylgeranyl reductase family protein
MPGVSDRRSDDFDAIVIGAGPAGSTAAYRLAGLGLSVLLLDKARFPRDKPCGGGVTMRAAELFPFELDAVVEDSIDCFEFGFAYARRFERRSPDPLILMTQRSRLDAFLVSKAIDAGVMFRDSTTVTDVEVGRDGVVVLGGGHSFTGKAVIGADGVNGVTARLLGFTGARRHFVALEGNLATDDPAARRFRSRVILELGVVPGGYGWIFPKRDHLNLGIAGWIRNGRELRNHLQRLATEHRLDADALEGLRGYRLPVRKPGGRLARGRALLVGDAAGLVDPLSGDGIFEAALSAKIAAEKVFDFVHGTSDDLESYETTTLRALNALTAVSWGAKAAVDRYPRTCFALMRTAPAWRYMQLFLGGDGREATRLRAPRLLAHLAGDPGRAYRAEVTSARADRARATPRSSQTGRERAAPS